MTINNSVIYIYANIVLGPLKNIVLEKAKPIPSFNFLIFLHYEIKIFLEKIKGLLS